MPRSKKGRFISKKQENRNKLSIEKLKKVNEKSDVSEETTTEPLTNEVDGNSDSTNSDTRQSTSSVLSTPRADENEWNNGRRIVEIKHLAEQLSKCEDCERPLDLRNIVEETRRGFGSIFIINCECGVLNRVETNKSHRAGGRGPAVFDINTKAAVGKNFYSLYLQIYTVQTINENINKLTCHSPVIYIYISHYRV